MKSTYETEADLAVEAVVRAAGLCRSVRRSFDGLVHHKADASPVTIADFGSQALICQHLSITRPHDAIIAEESAAELAQNENADLLQRITAHVAEVEPGANAATVQQWIDRGSTGGYTDRFWTLDPIDGTKGYVRGDQYAIALALIVEGRVVAGALACPNLPVSMEAGAARGVVMKAAVGGGTWMAGLDGARDWQRVRVSGEGEASRARFCESLESGHSSHDGAQRIARIMGVAAEPVRMDSQAKYATVARGFAEMYLRLPTVSDYRENIWDHAAGWLMVVEAGGMVTDLSGESLDFAQGRRLERNRGVLASNGRLHAQVLDAVKQAEI
jgi:3'(2'), 5'-bisphosphate nucleotidase